MGQIAFAVGDWSRAPGFAVALQSLRVSGLDIIMGRLGIDGINGLGDFPSLVRTKHGRLEKLFAFPNKTRTPGSGGLAQIDFAAIAGGVQGRPFLDRAMAIDAFDRRSGARFAVELS